jgi:hypothetical protein
VQATNAKGGFVRQISSFRHWVTPDGVRRSDAVSIGRKHESKDAQMVTFQVFKGRKRSVTFLTLPILPPFRDILDASERGLESWLETSFGKPYSVNGFGNSFKDWC